jgi:hypothetical protein
MKHKQKCGKLFLNGYSSLSLCFSCSIDKTCVGIFYFYCFTLPRRYLGSNLNNLIVWSSPKAKKALINHLSLRPSRLAKRGGRREEKEGRANRIITFYNLDFLSLPVLSFSRVLPRQRANA